MQRDTLFRIASMTKPITAAATMIPSRNVDCGSTTRSTAFAELANRRVGAIDAPLDPDVPAQRPITTRDLLTSLGMGFVIAPPGRYPIQKAIGDAGLLPGPNPSSMPPDEWMKKLGSLPLLHQPGEQWTYHTGSDVLGVLVARAADQPFAAFLQQRIFAPLGMNDTAFHVPPEKLDRLPPSYSANPGTGKLEQHDDPSNSRWAKPPAFPSGGGGLVSTVDDTRVLPDAVEQRTPWRERFCRARRSN